LQLHKRAPGDEGCPIQAASIAFKAFPGLKQLILVDEDVDIYDSNDVLWALATRHQTATEAAAGKTIFDCTVPFDQKDRFRRAQFLTVDPAKYPLNG
jgi:4-hydroxy-3-polyprenylbenzoate decarboxylase